MKYAVYKHNSTKDYLKVVYVPDGTGNFTATLRLVGNPEDATIFNEKQLRETPLEELLYVEDSDEESVRYQPNDFTKHLCQVVLFSEHAK